MLMLLEKILNSLFLLVLKIIGAIIVAYATYAYVQMLFKILINTITKV